jgi:DNA-binding beta-propeller fold protein YncE
VFPAGAGRSFLRPRALAEYARAMKGGAVARTAAHLAVAVLVLGGCAAAGKAEPVRLAWPPPPDPPRIEFVRSIVSDEDLARDTTFAQRMVNFLAGDRPSPNRLVEPMGLAVSDDGARLYVADYGHAAVFVFDFARNRFSKIGEQAPLARPVGLAVDAEDRLYVAEQAKKVVTVFDRQGQQILSMTHPTLERPTGIALDRRLGRIYVADTGHTRSPDHTVKIFTVGGQFAGTIGTGKGAAPGQLLFPTYVAVDADSNVYVTDTLNSRVQVFRPDGTYMRAFGQRGTAWGMFDKPKGVALDSFGNVYVSDSGWSNVQIFNQKGQVLLFFGGRGPLPGMLKNPTALAIDGKNQIYVADLLNHRVEMYRLVNTKAEDSYLEPANRLEGR